MRRHAQSNSTKITRLCSSLLHGSAIHLYFNYSTLRRLPAWLDASPNLYVFAYFLSVIAGNLFHAAVSPSNPVLGASGGICGLYGLSYSLLTSARRPGEAQNLLKSMAYMLLYGLLSGGESDESFRQGDELRWQLFPYFLFTLAGHADNHIL